MQYANHRIWSYVKHHLFRQSVFGLHSPFLYHLYTQVIRPKQYAAEELLWAAKIEAYRLQLLTDKRTIVRNEIGAGSSLTSAKTGDKETIAVQTVARRSACSPRKGRFLYRLTAFHQPSAILELGGNLGLSAFYQQAAAPQSPLISIEGVGPYVAVAQEGSEALSLFPIWQHSLFQPALQALDLRQFQQVLVDGDHRYGPTMENVSHLLSQLPSGALIILDDIYWSPQMTQAWCELIAHPRVSLSIDLYDYGLLWIEQPRQKQHFRLSRP